MLRLLKYTPLFPIYYIIVPEERHSILKTAVIQFVILISIILISGGNRELSNEGKGHNDSYTLDTEEFKIDRNIEQAYDKLKQAYNDTSIGNETEYKNTYNRVTTLPTDKDYTMAEEYYNILKTISIKTGLPKWVLAGISVMEGGSLYTKNPPIPGSAMPYSLYGVEGLNLTTYGYQQIAEGLGDRTAGVTDGIGVAGPYKMKIGSWDTYGDDGNDDGIKDRYNLPDAMAGAGNMINAYKSRLDEMGYNAEVEQALIWVAGAYNAGIGGMLARIPKDSIQEFIDIEMTELVNDRNLQAQVYQNYIQYGRGWKMRQPIIEFYDQLGWKADKGLREKIQTNIKDIELIQDEGMSNPYGTWAGDLEGNRVEEGRGYKTNRSSVEIMHRDNKDGDRISMNMESLEYLVATYSIGNLLVKELEYKLSVTSDGLNYASVSIDGALNYHWQEQMLYEQDNYTKTNTVGALGEVGYKGAFPIFIQKEDANYNSNLPWKFNGKTTTLGKSGCSLFSLTSMIHGAGLGNTYIPGTNKLPTVENLAQEFGNGPIIYADVIRKGYSVSLRSTKTKEDLDILYEDLKAGIPYVVNTRSGSIKGKTKEGDIVKTEFTYGGHFLILVSAYELDGKRYVEVVQTTRSNAGTTPTDQNAMAFDYDELIEKRILRSSAGHPVSAYTIVGIDSKMNSYFLGNNYNSPKTTTQQKSISSSMNDTRRKNVIMNKIENKNLVEFEKNVRPTKDMTPNINLKLKEKALVVYEDNNAVVFIDYNNAVLITNLIETPIYQGVMDEDVSIGITTDTSTYTYMTRTDDDRWTELKDNKVTED